MDYVLKLTDEIIEFAFEEDKAGFLKGLVTPLGSKTEDLLKVFRKMQYIDQKMREKFEAGYGDEECSEDDFSELPGYQAIMPLEIMLKFEE